MSVKLFEAKASDFDDKPLDDGTVYSAVSQARDAALEHMRAMQSKRNYPAMEMREDNHEFRYEVWSGPAERVVDEPAAATAPESAALPDVILHESQLDALAEKIAAKLRAK